MKFLKGSYLFTVEEVERLKLALEKGDFFNYNGKNMIPLYVEKKTDDIDQELFEKLVFEKNKKKEIYTSLNSSEYKLRKFCIEKYGTEEITEIRNKLKV